MSPSAQWVITDDGLECPSERYWIERKRLLEEREPGLLDLPLHLAEKNWVDLAAFEDAFSAAIANWHPNFPHSIVRRSFGAAREIKAECNRWKAASDRYITAKYPGQRFVPLSEADFDAIDAMTGSSE